MSSLEVREDPRYIKGQIYKVVSPNTEKIYIGSTITKLNQRFSKHKSNKACTSIHIINEGSASIELICDFPCKNKTELEIEEARWMLALREDGLDVINDRTPGATAAAGSREEYSKEYYKCNQQKCLEYEKKYRKANKEKIKEKKAEYQMNLPKIVCECCNKEFNKPHLNRHKTSKKYINNM
jgi:hypothetical protein